MSTLLQKWLEAHTHYGIGIVYSYPALLLSLIYFVSSNDFSSPTYRLPLSNSKLQVLDNPKSFDQRFGFITLIDILLFWTG